MTRIDDAISIAEKLSPHERLQLITRLWKSLPVGSWPQQSDVELADVLRRLAKLGAIIFGAVLGFVAGTLVGSLFMIADVLRRSMRSRLRRQQPEVAVEN